MPQERANTESKASEALLAASVASARAAGLHWVCDSSPGIRRVAAGDGFAYLAPNGEPVDDETRDRVRHLAIPPAWTDVWICTSATGHLQATGRDAKGRKQYRYHASWRERRNENKFGRMLAFAAALPKLRERVDRDLSRRGLPRERVLATVVQLLDQTLIRIGNAEYRRTNDSYGLTTLENRHVGVSGTALRFRFRGKSGKEHTVDVRSRRLAAVVKRCRDLPGQELFRWVDESGDFQPIDSQDVNDYLRDISGEDFTAKDFRTWGGTVLAARSFGELGPAQSKREAKKKIVACVKNVSTFLRNTPAVCRRFYVHPAIVAAFEDGSLFPALARHANDDREGPLRPEERATLDVLEAWTRSPGGAKTLEPERRRTKTRPPTRRPLCS